MNVIYNFGLTYITCTAYDFAGNPGSCTFIVNIVDQEAPSIQCPGSTSQVIPDAYQSVDIPVLLTTPTDNVAVASVVLTRNGVPIDPNNINSTFTVGTTLFDLTVYDTSNNFAECTWTTTVQHLGGLVDTTPPNLICPSPNRFYANCSFGGSTAAVAGIPSIGYNASDVASANFTYKPSKISSDNVFSAGTTFVKFAAADASGNTAYCYYYVTVYDTQPPVITCPLSFSQWTIAPSSNATVNWVIPYATDNVGIKSLVINHQPGVYAAGTYTVTASASDAAGNTVSCSFDFTVLTETTPPKVACPLSLTRNTSEGLGYAVVTWDTPVMSDTIGISSAVYSPITDTSGATFVPGITTINFIVTNVYNIARTCTFLIIVTDRESPVWAVCPESKNFTINKDQYSAQVTWETPLATDNVAVSSVTVTMESGVYLGAGSYDIRADAVDTSGNVADPCLFTITVLPYTGQNSPAASTSMAGIYVGAAAVAICALVFAVCIAAYCRARKVRFSR